MRLIETIHPLVSTRTYSGDEKFIDSGYITSTRDAFIKTDCVFGFAAMYKELVDIPLVEEVTISKYVIRISVVEAFAKEQYTWDVVESSVINAISRHLGRSVVTTPAHDDIAIHHNFETHRNAWRDIILEQLNRYKNLVEDDEETDFTDLKDFETKVSYLTHELKAFDEAFTQLAGLGLKTV